MSKFSGINANGIKNSVDTALRELQRYSLSGEVSALSNKNVLNSHACKVVDSLKKIQSSEINGCISNLKYYLTNLSSAATYIAKYQDAEKRVADLSRFLYYYDSEGHQCINYNIQSQINQLKSNMLSYERTIEYYLGGTGSSQNSYYSNSNSNTSYHIN